MGFFYYFFAAVKNIYHLHLPLGNKVLLVKTVMFTEVGQHS